MDINYHDDVFFYPWVGDRYKDGLRFNGDKIEFGRSEDDNNKSNGFYKLMILGCDHYCKELKHVQDRNLEQQGWPTCLNNLKNLKNGYIQKKLAQDLKSPSQPVSCSMHASEKGTDCAKLPICKYKTAREIAAYIAGTEKESDSHKNFRQTLGPASEPSLWNHILFMNFFQRSMPNSDDSKNQELFTGDEYKKAIKKFSQVIKEHLPDIIITWGYEGSPISKGLLDKAEQLEGEKITLRRLGDKKKGKRVPRIAIGLQAQMPFSILDIKDDSDKVVHSCLFFMLNHPASPSFCQACNHANIQCIFEHYTSLIKWKPQTNTKVIDNWISAKIREEIQRKRKVDSTFWATFSKEWEKARRPLLLQTDISSGDLKIFKKAVCEIEAKYWPVVCRFDVTLQWSEKEIEDFFANCTK